MLLATRSPLRTAVWRKRLLNADVSFSTIPSSVLFKSPLLTLSTHRAVSSSIPRSGRVNALYQTLFRNALRLSSNRKPCVEVGRREASKGEDGQAALVSETCTSLTSTKTARPSGLGCSKDIELLDERYACRVRGAALFLHRLSRVGCNPCWAFDKICLGKEMNGLAVYSLQTKQVEHFLPRLKESKCSTSLGLEKA